VCVLQKDARAPFLRIMYPDPQMSSSSQSLSKKKVCDRRKTFQAKANVKRMLLKLNSNNG